LRDEQGNLRGSISAFIDITERKKAEEALRVSNLYNRILIEASLDPLVTIGRDGKIMDVNIATEQVTGYSRNELIGNDFSDYFTEPEKARTGYQQVFIQGEVRDYPLEIQHKDGHITPVVYNASVYRDENDKVIGVFAAARDITELKRMEEQTRQRAEEMETVMEVAPVAIWIGHDQQCHNITGNRTANEFYEAEVGENVSAYTTPVRRFFRKGHELTANEMPMQKAALKNIDVRNEEIDVLLPSGEYRTLFGSASPLYDAEGNVRGSVGAFIDITERKKAEIKLEETLENLENLVGERTSKLQKAYNLLKESERGLAEAQRMAHIGNWDWNLATGEVYWSKELYRIFGCSPQKPGATLDEFLNYVYPDDRDRVHNAIKKGLDGEPIKGDYRIVLANGEERIVHTEAEVFYNENNNPIQVKGTVQDITEIKRVEEQIRILANIVESSNDAIGTISLDGKITSWNQEAENIYGYSVKEVLGKYVSILAPPHLDKEAVKLIEEIKYGKKVQRYETLRLRKDGKLINISITLSPVFDSYGKLIAVSFISRDITERKEAEEALRNFEIARKKELHHRIKNNLQVISSLLDLQADLFKGRENIRDSEVLKAFKESIDRVISIALIHEELYKGKNVDLLNFSQYIKELVNNLLLTYRLETDVSLDFDLEENILLDMDTAIPLGIVINETISNAFKYAFSGRDKGEIRVKIHRDEGEYEKESCKSVSYVLSISDNGVGIPENIDIENLDSLGLQLVTSLVYQLDGELEIKRNNGTEFNIKFNVIEKNN
jgi:PAS domain S-box-containing protein